MKVFKYWIEIVLFVLLLISFWAVFTIQLRLIPMYNTSWTPEVCNGINNLYLNLSYSYIAGMIIYLLTCYLPHYQMKRKLREVIRKKVEMIVRIIDDVVLEFSRDINTKECTEEQKLKTILNSKIWTDIIPMIQRVNNVTISYISFYNLQCKAAKDMVKELINMYGKYLTIEQITSLENWCNNRSFTNAKFLASIPKLNLEDPNGKSCLVDDFCNMYKEMKRIEGLFK